MILAGMTTVFGTLAALVGMIALTGRLLSRSRSKVAVAPAVIPAAPTQVEGSGVQPEASTDDLLRVALAAFSVHQKRRANAAPRKKSSAWTTAGRIRQIAPFGR